MAGLYIGSGIFNKEGLITKTTKEMFMEIKKTRETTNHTNSTNNLKDFLFFMLTEIILLFNL
jgi:hypothetical protein